MEQQNTLNLFENDEKYVKGRHLVTIFHNEQNLYSVIRIRIDETNLETDEKEAVITGHFPKIHEQETYIFYGDMQEHPKFGPQFQAKHFKKEIPQTKQGIITYLSSEMFSGIGKKTAERIVDALGENAISKILDQPSLLDTIPKLPPDKAKTLYDKLIEHQGLERVMIGLNQLGFGPQISMKIYQVYQEQALDIIQKNPYQLVESVEGIGFGRADEIGKQLGIVGNHPDRIKAGCMYTLEVECLQNGHVYMESKELLPKVKLLLEESQPISIEYSDISNEIIKLGEESKIVVENNKVYIPSLYFSEKGIVSNIQRILAQEDYKDQFPESEFLLALGELEDRIGVQYAPSQKEAIQTALMSPMMLLTGGPGTGKTTVIKGIVELYAELNGCSLDPKDYSKENPFPIILTAPTGRAAKRMSESTGLPAMTIHRLLGMTGQEDVDVDEDKQINGKIVIVDEMSMVDTWLAHQLLKAMPEQIQVIFVGDEDQLPSVGPGQVLKDLLRSKVIPTVQLTDIYRQEGGSSIIELAHDIKNGRIPQDVTKQQKDRSFIRCTTQQIPEVIEKIVSSAKRKGYTQKDVQVLAPMYRGAAGIDRLNVLLQEIFNPNKTGERKELSFGDIKYRIGDKVLQLVNQPEQHVFNGDIGEIISIFYAKENTEKQDLILISFDGIEVTYTRQDFHQFTHAYCCSIHKSQGSEFPIVILPVVKSYYRMLRRNLLYTAITRSKQSLIICGEQEAFRLGIERVDDQLRKTNLYDKLKILAEVTNAEKIVELSNETIMEIDPMIGMENVTPYDFM
ncbi:ATP-dependent RecD-like DNA helicase [Bacillus sporothermodurans]|uniref:ATP-dependent RecD2 DNA helicase n=1 Tax=Heyndrickxia sporothermodurans TaxID=46224 RepID=A0AB37H5N4_9BACI|nr:ATP-dependent RecD-like DNA helicase [Heyndrickxia sporothermodurans]MBL5769551.1 ATP-dependent RecD-like DNA helicase [Heyndrickxia sporothermodurans]MBL5773334.1 ATP-dependent RecD-like DNA helicase [Heyndrickxia sporothermodurans]MBL5776715.1 ATP-dependent RecD-like DNA helicase [Heyndrickxia sporothermodurans]MBL5780271.1 ATP-dependent RecD-like DNA helicase [Heyndrickxia sporothermodurans]